MVKKLTIYALLILSAVACHQPKQSNRAGIALSFDDRYVAQWDSLRPLLKQYDAKVTFYVTQFDSLTPQEVSTLHQLQQDGHEIGAHGAAHNRISEFVLSRGSLEAYFKEEVEAELNSMKKAGFSPTTYAHVGGQQTWFTDRTLLNRYFKLLRDVTTTHRDIGFISLRRPVFNLDEAFYAFDNNRTVNALIIDNYTHITDNELLDGLIRARATTSVLTLMGHKPLFDASNEPYGFSVKRLEYILQQAKRLGLKTYTMSELAATTNP